MGTTERRKREIVVMRRKILDTAMALFIEEGYDKVSIRRIAEKIEYSPATIYLYFKDKNEILYYLNEEGFDELLRLQEKIMLIAEPIERLRKLGEVYLEFAMANREYYDIMFIMKGPIRQIKQQWDCGFEAFDNLRKTVADCINNKLIQHSNPDVVALALWSQVHGLSSLIIRDRLPMFEESQLPELFICSLEFTGESILGSKP